MADALLQAQINAAVVAALAAQAAVVPAQVAHVAVKLPDFWVKDPKMWFSQAEAQFRRARITAETTMYDYVLMKLPEEVVMSVRALVSAIEADPVKQEQSYTLMKEALLGSYGKTKWQMAYALLDHPELGDRRPSAMMAEMLSLRSRPPHQTLCFSHCSSVGYPPPFATPSPRRTTPQRRKWLLTPTFSGTPGIPLWSPQ